MKDSDGKFYPSPDVHYQWNLKALSLVAAILQEAFKAEYENGEKSISDFYRDIKG